MAILSVKGVNKRFGGLQALDNVNLDVEEGKVHATYAGRSGHGRQASYDGGVYVAR